MENDTSIIEKHQAGTSGCIGIKCCGCLKNQKPVCFPSVSLHTLLEQSRNCFFIVDTSFDILYANSAMRKKTGVNVSGSCRSVEGFIHPDDMPPFYASSRSVVTGQNPTWRMSIRIRNADGLYTPSVLYLQSVMYSGKPAVLNAIRDKQPEALEHEIYQKVVDAYPEIALVLDAQGNIVAVNRYLTDKIGKNPEEIVHGGLTECIPVDLVPERTRMLERVMSTGEALSFSDCDKNNGTFEHFITPIRNDQGGVDKIVIFCRDISKTVETAESNRSLTCRLLSTIEDERKKLARDLHDECGQLVTLIGLGLSIIQKELPDELRQVSDLCSKYQAVVKHLGEIIKDISSELHPDLIDRFGLVPAVEWYLDMFFNRAGFLNHTFSCDVMAKSFGPKIDIALYRILQESLNNVVQHAQAKHVTVELRTVGETVRMAVTDDGIGLENWGTCPIVTGKRMGIGLLSMRERVEDLGGRFSMEPGPTGGTKLIVKIPIHPNI